MLCDICPRGCKIDRDNKLGFCGVSSNVKLAKTDVFMWEEPCISGTKGSGAIFFSGCNLKCCFCQNYQISSGGIGKEISVERLAEIFKELESKGVHNINLVSPSHYTNQIISALKLYRPKVPIVWNSNGYEKVETIEKLKDFIDIFLVDLKFYDEELSEKYCKAKNYFCFASKAILKMLEYKPKPVLENEILKNGVIIRHLVMPNCTEDSITILNWLSNIKNSKFLISIMGQYTPCFNSSKFPEINRPLKPVEYKVVVNKAKQLKLTDGYIQELDSCGEDFIPIWDFKGV